MSTTTTAVDAAAAEAALHFDAEAVALRIAAEYHAGQKDFNGQAYVLHLVRVGMKGETPRRRALGFLHDLLEDYPWTQALATFPPDATEEEMAPAIAATRAGLVEYLEIQGFDDAFLHSLQCLTKNYGDETYDAYLARVASDEDASWVKIADLEDNQDVSRFGDQPLTEKDKARNVKYQGAKRFLLDALDARKGNG